MQTYKNLLINLKLEYNANVGIGTSAEMVCVMNSANKVL